MQQFCGREVLATNHDEVARLRTHTPSKDPQHEMHTSLARAVRARKKTRGAEANYDSSRKEHATNRSKQAQGYTFGVLAYSGSLHSMTQVAALV